MADSPLRSVVKALTWQVMGLVVMTLITWSVTGSVAQGGVIAGLGSICGLVTYVMHERVWARVAWGRRTSGPGSARVTEPSAVALRAFASDAVRAEVSGRSRPQNPGYSALPPVSDRCPAAPADP